jgi:hypothetical protein
VAMRAIILSWIGARIAASAIGTGTAAAPAAAVVAAAMTGRASSRFQGG